MERISQKTFLITGASDGLGKATALQLAIKKYHVVIHGRNGVKTNLVKEEIIRESGNKNIETIIADFSSLDQVDIMAEEVIQRFPSLNVLINNAGIYMRRKEYTEDGLETTFAVNHLAGFKLTNRLIDLLKKNKPSRIINITSIGHKFVTINKHYLSGKVFFWDWVAYCRSKLLNLFFTFELAERLTGTGIVVNALHPGVIKSNLTSIAKVGWGITAEEGAKTIVNLATLPEYGNVTGQYFEKNKHAMPSLIAKNKRIQRNVWEVSLELANAKQINRNFNRRKIIF